MKKETVASCSIVATSFLAASCCIGPAIFVVFGASIAFLGRLTFMEAFRPYLLGAGGGLLGYSFWRLYLKKTECNCKGDVRAQRIARVVFWFGFAAIVFAASFQTILLWIYG
jgi:mercuric ion transport protein